MHVLDISGPDPDKGFGFRDAVDHLIIQFFIGYKFYAHNSNYFYFQDYPFQEPLASGNVNP